MLTGGSIPSFEVTGLSWDEGSGRPKAGRKAERKAMGLSVGMAGDADPQAPPQPC